MKKMLSILICAIVLVASFAGCSSSSDVQEKNTNESSEKVVSGNSETDKDSSPEVPAWEPKKNVQFFVASSPGGGSDMYTRAIADVMSKQDLVEKTIIVSNETDGGGAVIRNKVAHAKDDHQILAFVSGAIRKMLMNTDLTMDDFTPWVILAADKQLLYVWENSQY